MKKIRLQKYLSSCGVESRRKSEELIKQGLIKVNDEIITQMGFCVSEDDKIEYNGRIIKPIEQLYIVLNKPKNFVCSRKDYLERKTIYDIVDDKTHSIFSVGRLDYNSIGILILTNDGDFANSLCHPSNNIVKYYRVTSKENVSDKLIDNFTKGVVIEGVKYTACNIKKISSKIIEIALQEGKKREIREVYKNYNIEIIELKRIAFGKMRLDELKINLGEYKFFTKEQLKGFIYGKNNSSSN
ncbi:MAG: hypothetical protein A2086_07550 [Spirochaetes bacterium GWD1_27_9]|nr:MAG: hypothetical protein A2Z98_10530 [Spirochaetes bacterium GWB1_27_13]OHD22236.1 MAG: hypothetical protein A2Y34_00465 [Spirochaetes bacterium GWC1_27_15]OHD44786.1 MAG: hypothetical protein A2086_07550 [Spirochaetes bacterium GWD1_27_9]